MKYIISFVFVFACIFCLHRSAGDGGGSMVMADTSIQNPNGSSELAKLMRDMEAFTKQAKTDVQEGKPAAAYPEAFSKLYTAKISEGMDKSDFYNSFADLYIASVKNYAAANPTQRVELYNNMVSACLACHSQHCPGPVKAIRKLTIE